MDDKTKKLLNTKLRQPVHISYISKYILKLTEKETKEILDKLIEEGVIEESPLASGITEINNYES
jgi:phosphoribosyl-ATP pyrophosphohydrolase